MATAFFLRDATQLLYLWGAAKRSLRIFLHWRLFYRDAVHANEYGEQILSKILLAFWTGAEPGHLDVRGTTH